jgi:[CysO sulfur-carrier protein]-S-L-cysteine hydrolase
VRISRALLDRVVEHAQRDAPDECVGVVSSRDGEAVDVHPLENLAHSPLRFEVGADLARLAMRLDDEGLDYGAIYHSHTRTAPYPSQTDINFSVNWPGTLWIIVGTVGGGDPEVRTFRIEDGQVHEVALEVV